MLEKGLNQIDEDNRSQHYATLNRGMRGGCFNDLCHWLQDIHIGMEFMLINLCKKIVAFELNDQCSLILRYLYPCLQITESF